MDSNYADLPSRLCLDTSSFVELIRFEAPGSQKMNEILIRLIYAKEDSSECTVRSAGQGQGTAQLESLEILITMVT